MLPLFQGESDGRLAKIAWGKEERIKVLKKLQRVLKVRPADKLTLKNISSLRGGCRAMQAGEGEVINLCSSLYF